ncbi:serine/threonine-protein kinase [Mycolicibacterium neworleansense]|uniref:non-specific serine/threonine protein kinase n=1 Tax=Mycolicibacterium neworleansense TaxID=146018 RepID=A0A0H5RY78_9MYCO|nr:serine/threonine-protein kinase [Mycolicibacterium neworleansense]MCV7360956.1 serine/threonine protein kinase [Mycolicibacterium neworleansense]CRZ18477.1 serine/threonine protein kinase [Mycolicibacterium neworleansense]
MPSPEVIVAGYTAVKVVGSGGSAVVYLARDADGATVALKILDDLHRQPAHLARLQREFDFARRISHPNIVTVYAAGPGWLTMEFLDGGTVSNLPGIPQRLTALAQIAAALDLAHRRGIVHCDVKPANILVDQPFSRAVLIDFGVAHSMAEDVAARLAHDRSGRMSLDPARRITRQAFRPHPNIQASLPYSAPELLVGRTPSAATDQYALACTTVELLTGSPPFTADTAMALIDHQLYSRPPRISQRHSGIPRALDPVIAKAMAKEPDRRHGSCSELVGLITAVMEPRCEERN